MTIRCREAGDLRRLDSHGASVCALNVSIWAPAEFSRHIGTPALGFIFWSLLSLIVESWLCDGIVSARENFYRKTANDRLFKSTTLILFRREKFLLEKPMKLTTKKLRAIIYEELTGADKDEIKKIASKEVEKALQDKKVKDMIEKEVKKELDGKATKEQIGDITKSVIKKLYKDLSYHHPYIIDRIKI